MENNAYKIKRLEASKKWRDNNREKYRQISLDSARKKKALNPEVYLQTMRDRAKKYRLQNPEVYRKRFRAWYDHQNRDEINAKHREYMKKNPEKSRQYNLNRKDKAKIYARGKWLQRYGLTQESFNQMLLKQEGKCAICKLNFENTKPNIDHCHTTERVRGLLCSPCNIVLGYVEKIQKRTSGFNFEKFTEYLK